MVLPGLMAEALEGPDLEPILGARSGPVPGRGASPGLAQEAALKMKARPRFPAEASSSAEVARGLDPDAPSKPRKVTETERWCRPGKIG